MSQQQRMYDHSIRLVAHTLGTLELSHRLKMQNPFISMVFMTMRDVGNCITTLDMSLSIITAFSSLQVNRNPVSKNGDKP
jgi:hypothetical protein